MVPFSPSFALVPPPKPSVAAPPSEAEFLAMLQASGVELNLDEELAAAFHESLAEAFAETDQATHMDELLGRPSST